MIPTRYTETQHVGNTRQRFADIRATTPAATGPVKTLTTGDGTHDTYPSQPGGNHNVLRTIQRSDLISVSLIGAGTTVVAIRDDKVANLLIALLIVCAVGMMLKAAVAAISDTMLKSIDDAYDAGKEVTEHKADVLDLAMKRRGS